MAIALAGIAYAVRQPVLRSLGRLLVYEKSDFERVDAVVVLPGSVPDRVLEAFDLMSDGRAKQAFLLAGEESELRGLLTDLGVDVPDDRKINRRVLLAKGIPAERIVDIPGNSRSSFEDGLLVREFMRDHAVASVAVVTCKYHSYRAYLLFREALDGTGTSVYSTPSRYCSFQAEDWWRHRSQAKAGLLELAKLGAYWLGVR